MFNQFKHVVRCTSCGEEHSPEEVRVENIESDYYGQDVITYECPKTGDMVKSLVLVTR